MPCSNGTCVALDLHFEIESGADIYVGHSSLCEVFQATQFSEVNLRVEAGEAIGACSFYE